MGEAEEEGKNEDDDNADFVAIDYDSSKDYVNDNDMLQRLQT